MRAVIYKRVSVLKNTVDGTSLDVQQERLEAYAKAHGWDVIATYEDAGISAKDTNRPALQRMLKDAENGKFDVILVYKLDRLSRSVSDFHKLANFLDQHKVTLVSVTQRLDTSSPTGRLLRNILVDFANFERELITERVVDNKIHRAQEGKWNGGHAPFGYKLVDKKIVVVPDEAAQVKEVYRLYNTGRISMRKLAKQTGISFSQVELILMNPIYAGKLAWGKTKYKDHKGMFRRIAREDWIMADGEHEPLISYEDWEKAQSIKSKKKSIPDERNPRQIFKDICFCGKCGSKLYFFSGYGTYHYYRCHDMNRFEGCRNNSVRQDEIEEKVVRKINDLLSDKLFWKQARHNIKIAERSNDVEIRIKQAQKQMEKVEEKVKRLVEQMADGEIAHLIKPNLLKLENERKELQRMIMTMEAERPATVADNSNLANTIMNDIMSNWDKLTLEEKSEGIHLLVNRIVCDQEKVSIEWTEPNLPTVEFLLHKRGRNGRIVEFRY